MILSFRRSIFLLECVTQYNKIVKKCNLSMFINIMLITKKLTEKKTTESKNDSSQER